VIVANTSDSHSVIIVGAGPVGLGLACDLGQRGVDCLLIERRDGTVEVPRQSMVSARNMEFCRHWGVAQTVRTAVWPENHPRDFVYLASMRGCELLRMKVPSYRERDRRDFTPEAACPCPQIYFDPILAKRARSLPAVTLAYNTRLDRFAQDDTGVTVHVTDLATGAVRTLRSRYLVGCDGSSGAVRGALGYGVEGLGTISNSVNLFFRSTELATAHDKGWARFYRPINDTGCWGELIPIDGKELWRLTVFDEPLSKADPGSLLEKLVGGPFAYEMINVSPWQRRDYVAKRYGEARVFIAGDAAHECSPTGGIGMHTGLEEAVNLGWKLTAMVEGWGGPALLQSYEAERRPIAVRNAGLATQSYNALAALPGWSEGQTGWQANTAWLSIPEHIKLGYCYEDSPICVADGTPAPVMDPKQFVPSARPGARAPHAWLDDGRSTLDLFGDGFVLVQLGAHAPDAAPLQRAAGDQGMPMRTVAIADAEIAALYETQLVLVRPDGHVAWRGDDIPADATAIVQHVRGATGERPIMPDRRAEASSSRALLL
jgi:2-polyprenyl-6-methoxyphenol hydroxylase-like FAD-dependent oxidoreductase